MSQLSQQEWRERAEALRDRLEALRWADAITPTSAGGSWQESEDDRISSEIYYADQMKRLPEDAVAALSSGSPPEWVREFFELRFTPDLPLREEDLLP